jgi:hypothetical protein
MKPPMEAIAPKVHASTVGGCDFNASSATTAGVCSVDTRGVMAGVVAAGVSAGRFRRECPSQQESIPRHELRAQPSSCRTIP